MQYLEARSKGRVVTKPTRDSRQGLDVAYLSALTTAAKLAEEEMRIKNHFVTQTMSLKVCDGSWPVGLGVKSGCGSTGHLTCHSALAQQMQSKMQSLLERNGMEG